MLDAGQRVHKKRFRWLGYFAVYFLGLHIIVDSETQRSSSRGVTFQMQPEYSSGGPQLPSSSPLGILVAGRP